MVAHRVVLFSVLVTCSIDQMYLQALTVGFDCGQTGITQAEHGVQLVGVRKCTVGTFDFALFTRLQVHAVFQCIINLSLKLYQAVRVCSSVFMSTEKCPTFPCIIIFVQKSLYPNQKTVFAMSHLKAALLVRGSD